MEQTESTATDTGRSISQPDFTCTPYVDATYAVVGEAPEESVFEPMEVGYIPSQRDLTDPMFANYGGVLDAESTIRWHLPKGVEFTASDKASDEEAVAQKQADQIAEQLEQARNEAYARGKTEALEEAVLHNSGQLQELQERSHNLIKDLAAQVLEFRETSQREAVKLAVAIAEKIVGTVVETNPEYLVPLVNQAIEHSSSARIECVRVSPQDMEFIEVVGIAKQLKNYEGGWAFRADPTIRSGCVMETSAGELDFSLDAAWERVKDQILGAIK
mgnify:CR=1 FL=1